MQHSDVSAWRCICATAAAVKCKSTKPKQRAEGSIESLSVSHAII